MIGVFWILPALSYCLHQTISSDLDILVHVFITSTEGRRHFYKSHNSLFTKSTFNFHVIWGLNLTLPVFSLDGL